MGESERVRIVGGIAISSGSRFWKGKSSADIGDNRHEEPWQWRVGHPPHLRWNRWRPQLVLRENYRRPVTWTLRGLGLVGLSLSFAYMRAYVGFAVAVAIATVEQVLERSLFLYSTIHVQPMPTFEYDPAKWTSLAYVGLGKSGVVTTHVLGLVFSDSEYAGSFFSLLRDWNLGSDDDHAGNIRLSFIRDQDSYFLWLYPGHNRAPVRTSWQELLQRAHHKREDAEPFLITLSPYFCKNFLTKGALAQFLAAVTPGDTFQLAAMRHTAAGDVEFDGTVDPLRLHSYKIRERSALSDKDYEFAVWRLKGKL